MGERRREDRAVRALAGPDRSRTAAFLLAVAATYALGAQIGFLLRFPPATTSLIWPPNALLTAVLLMTPPQRWWLCIVAAFPAHVLVELAAGFSLPFLLALFATNCLEALVAASAIHRWSDNPVRFDTLHRVIVFVGGAVFLAPLVSSFPDAAAVSYFQGESFRLVFLRRLFSNSLSQLTIVPSAVLVARHALDWLRFSSRRRRAEALLVSLALVVLCALVFSGYQRGSPFLPGGPYTALPFLMPLLVFAGVRFGPAGASLSLLATALLAIASAMSGWSPLTALPAEERVRALQVFLILVGIPLLVSSALIEERRRTADTLRERLRFEAFLSQLSGAFVQLPSHQMDREFETWQERVAKLLELDRVVLWRLRGEDEALDPVAVWTAPHAPFVPVPMERVLFTWSIPRLLRQEPFLCSAPEELPPEARAERERLRSTGVRSVLALPLVAGEQVLGCLALVTTRTRRDWAEDLVSNCRLVADVFAAALARKLAEDALRASESMKSAVLESLTSQVAVLDRDGWIIAVNDSWTRFGRPSRPFANDVAGVGANYFDALRRAGDIGDDDALEAFAGTRGVLSGDLPHYSQEYRIRNAAGERWYHLSVVPLDRPDGGAVISHADVTERRIAEREAQTSRQELAHYLRVSTIGELTTSIAHELNQPLAAIVANAQAARKFLAGTPDPEKMREVREIVGDIIEEGRRAGEVIRGLRELLRKGETTREELDVNGLVRGVVKLLGNDVMIRGVTLRSDLADEVLATRGNRVQLQQVLLNLVVNALEALADTEGDRRLGIRTERLSAGVAQISVEDNGPGLPLPLRREVFKPFFTTKPQGMGMGLSIARSILQAHGGTIAVDSARQNGACFTLTLPLAEARQAEAGSGT
jgi:signal transduction histidine kinase/integral membrane sensor domain MASE1